MVFELESAAKKCEQAASDIESSGREPKETAPASEGCRNDAQVIQMLADCTRIYSQCAVESGDGFASFLSMLALAVDKVKTPESDINSHEALGGAKGFTSPVSKIDLRVGGQYLNCMRSPEGKDYWSKGFYREIVAPERLVMIDSFADESGNMVPASYYGMSKDFPLEMLITVTFEELNGKTRLTLRHVGIPPG